MMYFKPFTHQPKPEPKGLAVRVDQTGHVWCGPAALSAALKITTSHALKIIKLCSMRRSIKGVTYGEMNHAVASQGIKTKVVRFPRKASDCLTLKSWLKTRKESCTYLVCITGHWITIRGNHWVCNMNPDARLVDDIPYLRAKVRYTIQLLEDQPQADQG
jgi:hypothetical protein